MLPWLMFRLGPVLFGKRLLNQLCYFFGRSWHRAKSRSINTRPREGRADLHLGILEMQSALHNIQFTLRHSFVPCHILLYHVTYFCIMSSLGEFQM